jgi:isoquinoline 1-oxidoreductase subunit beta
MTIQEKEVSTNVSRRGFIAGAAGVTFAFAMTTGPGGSMRKALGSTADTDVGIWVSIAADGATTIMSPASEMGQGVFTAMPILIAEEMDADWNRVTVKMADAMPGYGNPGFGNLMVTGASRTTQGYWMLLRKAGAQVRQVLMASAAKSLGVPMSELTTEPGVIMHAGSGRKVSYGDAAKTAVVPEKMPEIADGDLKPKSEWRLIGKKVDRVEIPDKVRGTADFGIDTQLPGMLYASIMRAPAQGNKPLNVDDAAAKKVAGITAVIPLPYGVAVVGKTYDATLRAREVLKVEWSKTAKSNSYNSDDALVRNAGLARDWDSPGVVHETHGDAAGSFSGAAKTLFGEYQTEHLYHATMEPMNATAWVKGKSAEVWAPTQAPSITQFAGAGVLKTSPANITVHVTMLGGGYGRRVEQDYAVDALILSNITKAPVKVIWKREDDVASDVFRPLTAQRIDAALDANNKIVGWKHRIVGESIMARFRADAYEKSGGKDETVTDGAQIYYDIPNRFFDYVRDDTGIGVGFWRAVGVGYTKFAIESFIDEVAHSLGEDPIAYRIAMQTGDPRGMAVTKAVAKMAGWGRTLPAGRALGFGLNDFWNSKCAQIAEVSVDKDSGDYRVHKVWCAVDPGIIIQPDNVVAQMEGAIIHSLSALKKEAITIKGGVVQQSNFHDYHILRMEDAPEIEVQLLENGDRPGGIGEVGLPPLPPAVANAIFNAVGARVRSLPITPEKVKAALKA